MALIWKQGPNKELRETHGCILEELFQDYHELYVDLLGTPGPHASVYRYHPEHEKDCFPVSTPRTPLAVGAMKPDIDMDESWINGVPEPNDAAAVHQSGSWDVRRCGRAHL